MCVYVKVISNLSKHANEIVLMPYIKKVISLLVIMTAFVVFDVLYLPAVDHVRIYNVVFEFSFAAMAMVMYVVIGSLKGKSFYNHLKFGFLLLFISMLVDGLDQFHLHGELYTAVAEKATMLIGFVLLFVGINKWIVDFGKLNRKLETQAYTDELTGLYNRRGMLKEFEAMNKRAMQENKPLSFIIADLDDFKDFNDSFGHLSGDQFLADLGHSLMNMMGKDEVIGRWGGEEFAICMLGSDLQAALSFAEQIRIDVSNLKLPVARHKQAVTLSLGVSQKLPEEPLMDAIKRADRSLYSAKKEGKNITVAA